MNQSIEEMVLRLRKSTGVWVSCDSTWMLKGMKYTRWDLDRDQFLLCQDILSDSGIGSCLEDNVRFLEARENRLEEEFIKSRGIRVNDQNGSVNKPSYCRSGWKLPLSSYLSVWYENTNGTIFCHSIFSSSKSEDCYSVYVPQESSKPEQGGDHMQIRRVASGMTKDQYERWRDCGFHSGSEGDNDYTELATFHNLHLVPQGWEPMKTLQQLQITRRTEQCIKSIHGSWSDTFGIGDNIRKIVGLPGDNQSTLVGDDQLKESQEVLKKLRKALCQWEKLHLEWGEEANLREPESE